MGKIFFYKYDGTLDHDTVLSEDTIVNTNGMLIKCKMKDNTEKVGYSDPYRFHDDNTTMDIKDYIYLITWKNLDEDKHELIGDDNTKYDQLFEKVNIKDIDSIEAILYSNPRWGGRLTNKFEFHPRNKSVELSDVTIPDFLKKSKNPICPKCNKKLVEIVYGMPSSEMFKKAKNKEVKLGGCEITEYDPKYYCYNCNKNYYDDLKECIEDKTYFYVYVEYVDMTGDKLYCYKSENRDIKKDDIVLVDRAGEVVYGKVINTKEYTQETAPYPPFLTKDILEVHKDKTIKNIFELHTRRTDLLEAHNYSFKNRKQLEKDKKCGCFYCCKIFNPKDIEEWCDDEDTAICPYCGIDSVIGESSGYPIDEKFLSDMKKHWF